MSTGNDNTTKPTNEYRKRMFECALAYIKKGWLVLPLVYKGKAPHGRLVPNGSIDATKDEATVRSWFSSGESFNIGICAGKQSGLVILDVDPEHGGDESLAKFKVPQTPTVQTGGGGRHFYFKHPGTDVRNSAGTIGPGLPAMAKG